MAALLKEANCSLPLSLTASVNRNGAVTLTANPYTPSSTYSPFFNAMTKKLNQSFPVGDNPFQVFREAPTSVELLIHNLPLSILPHEPTDLFPSLLESISNAIDVPIFGARFIQSDPVKRAEQRTTSGVMAVDPLHIFPVRGIHSTFLPRPHSRPRLLCLQIHAVPKVLACWPLCSVMQRRGTSLPYLHSPPSPLRPQMC